MFDPTITQEAVEHTSEVVDKAARDKDPETREAIEAMWYMWLALSGSLLSFGVSQRDLCDSAGTLTSIKEDASTRHTHAG